MHQVVRAGFLRIVRSNTLAFPSIGRLSSSAAAAPATEPSVDKAESGKENPEVEARRLNPPEATKSEPVYKKTPYVNEQEENFTPYRFIYPDFLPDPNLKWRNRVREKLERMDMLRRRSHIDIPEFYVGSILSVTVSDRNAPGKTTTFVGICTERDGNALRSKFTLRNVVDGSGVEICYDLYNPTIINITVLRLERRLDENLRYLRDAPLEYSTFPFDMVPEVRAPDAPVPVNPLVIKMNPRPWTAQWHNWDLKGVEDLTVDMEDWRRKKMERHELQTGKATLKYDLMKKYRATIPAEEQTEIYSEVHQQLSKLTASLRKQKRKRTFVKPQKTV